MPRKARASSALAALHASAAALRRDPQKLGLDEGTS